MENTISKLINKRGRNLDRKTIVVILLKCIFFFFILTGVCHSVSIINIDAEKSGWVQYNGTTNGTNPGTTNYIAGTTESNGLTYKNFFVFDLSEVAGHVNAATLKLQNPIDGFYSYRNEYFGISEYYTYSITGFYGSGINSSDLLPQNWQYPYTGIAAYNIINSPVRYGDVEVNESSNGTTVEIQFNSAGIANLNSFIDSGSSDTFYALGGILMTTSSLEVHIFSNTGYNLYSRVLSLEIEEALVRVEGVTPAYYLSLQAAYDNSSNGDIIQTQAVPLNEDLYIDLDTYVTISGGYDESYTLNNGITRLDGDIIVSNGTVIIENIILE